MNIYLDIDGTLIHEDGNRAGKSAEGLTEFIVALRPHNVYWLTTHCMDGDPVHAQKLMKASVPEHLHADIDRIKPTVWRENKTEAIDFSREFIWFDNDVYPEDRQVLLERAIKDGQWLIEVHLDENPNRLIDILKETLQEIP